MPIVSMADVAHWNRDLIFRPLVWAHPFSSFFDQLHGMALPSYADRNETHDTPRNSPHTRLFHNGHFQGEISWNQPSLFSEPTRC